jgi:hypothetical protein
MVHTLIPSDRVETAAVYGRGGQKIGTIERLMLEKRQRLENDRISNSWPPRKPMTCRFTSLVKVREARNKVL